MTNPIHVEFDPARLTAPQADGTACVVCGADYFTSDVPSTRVGTSSAGIQVFACVLTCIPAGPGRRETCPSWCTLISCAGWHWGAVDSWDGPRPCCFEVAVTAKGDDRPVVVIVSEEWDGDGETVRRSWEELTPVVALATGLLVRGQLGAALLAAAAGIRVQPERRPARTLAPDALSAANGKASR